MGEFGGPRGPPRAPFPHAWMLRRSIPPRGRPRRTRLDGAGHPKSIKTPLDNVNLQERKGSLSAMDSNWVGGKCTQKAINAGQFEGRTRKPNDAQFNN